MLPPWACESVGAYENPLILINPLTDGLISGLLLEVFGTPLTLSAIDDVGMRQGWRRPEGQTRPEMWLCLRPEPQFMSQYPHPHPHFIVCAFCFLLLKKLQAQLTFSIK